ncbi:MAG: NADH-quinone oxidoreductase subunit A [Bdellovibrionia bacterium]
MIDQLVPVIFLFVFVMIFGAGLLYLTSLVGPKMQRTSRKMMPYECGIPGQETETTKIPIKFYLTAILFILFDIEVVFMYPWAVIYSDYLREAGAFILIEMLVFMATLIFGLFYVWRVKGLQWE